MMMFSAHLETNTQMDSTNFKIFSDRECDAGGQLFEDYGDNDNYLYDSPSSIDRSRALTMRGKRFLVPFSDMFNYQPQKVSVRCALLKQW